VFELLRGRPELMNELPAMLATVTEDQIQSAAAAPRPYRGASLEVIPGAAR